MALNQNIKFITNWYWTGPSILKLVNRLPRLSLQSTAKQWLLHIMNHESTQAAQCSGHGAAPHTMPKILGRNKSMHPAVSHPMLLSLASHKCHAKILLNQAANCAAEVEEAAPGCSHQQRAVHFHSCAGMLLDGPASPGHCVFAISMKRTLCLHWRAKNTPPAEAPPSSQCRPEHKPNTRPTLPYYAENPKWGQRRLHYSCFCIWPNSKNNQQQTSKSDLAILGSLHKQRRKANISRKLHFQKTVCLKYSTCPTLGRM